MATPIKELFNRGLVTSRPSHMLSAGELAKASHTVYRENNPAIVRAPDHGLYSTDNLSDYNPNANQVDGLVFSNLRVEDFSNHIIAKVGRDLYSSKIVGLDNNTFSPITSAARITGTVGKIEKKACVFNSSSKTVTPQTGNFNGLAVVGRPVYSPSSCPGADNYVIAAVNYTGNNITSIVLNDYPKWSQTEYLYFAPKFTIPNSSMYVFYNESVGFTGKVTDAEQIAETTRDEVVEKLAIYPGSDATSLNKYVAMNREVSITAAGVTNKYYLTNFTIDDNTGDIVEISFANQSTHGIDSEEDDVVLGSRIVYTYPPSGGDPRPRPPVNLSPGATASASQPTDVPYAATTFNWISASQYEGVEFRVYTQPANTLVASVPSQVLGPGSSNITLPFTYNLTTIPALSANTNYKWEVWHPGTDAYPGIKATRYFRTATAAPGAVPSAPTLSLPANHASGVSAQPIGGNTFVWNSVSNADSYDLQIGTSSGMTTLVYSATGIKDTYLIVTDSDLTAGSTFHWRVRAVNATGASDWSTVWDFTIQAAETTSVKWGANNLNFRIVGVTDGESAQSLHQGYKSCYLNIFMGPGTYSLIFNAGIGRSLAQREPINSLSWDDTAILWGDNLEAKRVTSYYKNYYTENDYSKKSLIYRPLGLNPVTKAPKITVTATEDSNFGWNAALFPDENPATGAWFWFLITEVALLPDQDASKSLGLTNLLESAYLAKKIVAEADSITAGQLTDGTGGIAAEGDRKNIGVPVPAYFLNNRRYIRMTMPAPANDGTDGRLATHWAVYISNNNQANGHTPPALNTFHRTGLFEITQYFEGQEIILRDRRDVEVLTSRNVAPVTGRNFPLVYERYGLYYHEEGENGPWTEPNPEDLIFSDNSTPKYLFLSGRGTAEQFSWWTPGIYLTDWQKEDTNSYASPVVSASPPRTLMGVELTLTCGSPNGENLGFTFALCTARQEGTENLIGELHSRRNSLRTYGSPVYTLGLNATQIDWRSFKVRFLKAFTNGSQEVALKANCISAQSEFSNDIPPVEGELVYATNENRESYLGGVGKSLPWEPKIILYWTGTTINVNGPQYRTVNYVAPFEAATVNDPAMLAPPLFNTAIAFNGSLVTNTVTEPNVIRYSMPNLPEQFPKPYFIKLGSKARGKVTSLSLVNKALVVGMERAIKRVNYLPKESDTDFSNQTGAIVETVTDSHGIPGHDAVTNFDMPGIGEVLAYVSPTGLRMTDGGSTRALNTDVRLSDYVHPLYWGKCMLKNYPVQKWLILYYVPKDSTHGVRSKSLVFSYSEDHLKATAPIEINNAVPLIGPLPVTGPNDCYLVDAVEATINDVPAIVTTDGEYVYVEDSLASSVPVKTVTDADDATRVNRINAPVIKSRDIFPAGDTMEGNIGTVYLIHETHGHRYPRSEGASVKGSTELTFTTPLVGHTPVPGERIIHPGWDGVVSILSIDNNNYGALTLSAPAVRSATGETIYDTGTISVKINAGQIGEDMNNVLTEYRSTSVGINQSFLADVTANRFSIEISKLQLPTTNQQDEEAELSDLDEEMSIIGLTYHGIGTGEANLHTS